MIRLDFSKRWNNFHAGLNRIWAARVEAAPFGWVNRGRNIALKYNALSCGFNVRIGYRNCGNQRLCVGHQRLFVDRLRISYLGKFTEIHYSDAVRNVANRSQVVRDEEVCQILLTLKLFQQIHDLRLNGNVECGDWLISHYKLRIDRQRAGDTNSLALTTRELVRITLDIALAQANGFHKLVHTLFRFPSLRKSKCFQGLTDNLTYCHSRIQRGVRVLKNDLQMAAMLTHFSRRKMSEIAIMIEYPPGGRFSQPQNCAA
ncbi:MAG: hypothetical protein AUI36_32690 [Cyanobacteria bacterium 13_1_40CM_2_61_4]|nr:MAG: hypothetical protein AUI36_32690 [Cyanobacteria bacterium 13_1_40CM_2_61_4]